MRIWSGFCSNLLKQIKADVLSKDEFSVAVEHVPRNCLLTEQFYVFRVHSEDLYLQTTK